MKTVAKHVPMRTCIGTRQKFAKKDLVRFVFDQDSGKIMIDKKGKSKGRGANMSLSENAFDLAVKSNAFQRALKLESKITQAEVDILKKEFLEYIEERKFRPHNKPVVLRVEKDKKFNVEKTASSSNG